MKLLFTQESLLTLGNQKNYVSFEKRKSGFFFWKNIDLQEFMSFTGNNLDCQY
jgi:hypothetical protein